MLNLSLLKFLFRINKEEVSKTLNNATLDNKVNILTLKPSFALRSKQKSNESAPLKIDFTPNAKSSLKFPMINSQNSESNL